ncbi:hypothetical protein GGR42_002035 [Saonia flava]|uniref:DUF541 domain-containing protein n=1 Tax=Saonia flava TaxID=523696 RepID=A0A846QZF2_9FLAO|nr:SIMPL domain-containing protein [Saonia flava]NJB71573.1 hypothetical protein [Saonia flava]
MKILLTKILFILFPLSLLAQQQTIKVSARATHIDSSPIFKTTVSLSTSFSSYAGETMNLKQLKEHYKAALVIKNIPWETVKETPNGFGFETMGYDKEGVVLEYTSSSVKEMKRFLTTKSLGLQKLNTIAIIEIDPEEAKELYKKALENAHMKAQAIAFAMDRELGKILQVEDNLFTGQKIETSIYYDRPAGEYILSIQIVFEVI